MEDSISVSTTEYTSFDILGRVLAAKQTTDGQNYTTGYVYNLSGSLIEETYPSGRKAKNVLDASGDLSMVQSAKCGITHVVSANCPNLQGYWNYAKNFTHNAAGILPSLEQIALRAFLLILVLLLWGTLAEAKAQREAQLTYIQSLTEDNIFFRIKPRKSNYAPDEAILVDYQVRNRSKRSVYIIVESKIYLPKAKIRWQMEVPPPANGKPNQFMDYKLLKIVPGKTLNGTIVITNDQIPRDLEYDEEVWEVKLGFSYSFDTSTLKNCSNEYKLPCLNELFQKSKNLSMGDLVIQIKNR